MLLSLEEGGAGLLFQQTVLISNSNRLTKEPEFKPIFQTHNFPIRTLFLGGIEYGQSIAEACHSFSNFMLPYRNWMENNGNVRSIPDPFIVRNPHTGGSCYDDEFLTSESDVKNNPKSQLVEYIKHYGFSNFIRTPNNLKKIENNFPITTRFSYYAYPLNNVQCENNLQCSEILCTLDQFLPLDLDKMLKNKFSFKKNLFQEKLIYY